MTETQERFLRAVLSRVALDAVVEFHLFPPIRRGTLETGVAVIATVIPPPPLAVMPDERAEPRDISVAAESEAMVEDVGITDDVEEIGGVVTINLATDDGAAVQSEDNTPRDETPADEADEAREVVGASAAQTVAPRLRILTASYRHTIKGVERGKWTVDVQEEADAPREAVEAVLRGVRHRSAEPADPELVSHDTLAALLTQVAVAPAA